MTARRPHARPNARSPRRDLVPIDALVQGLTARIDSLARELLPNGRRESQEWRVGSLQGEPGQSLGVHLAGDKAGVWRDFANGIGGDALDLVAQVLFGGRKVDAIKWAKGWLGLDGTDPASLRQTRAALARATERPDAEVEAKKRRERALALWLSARRDLIGTPVEAYLGGRGIGLARFPGLPGALRYHERLFCKETETHFPAMLGLVASLASGKPIAVHRTWLAPHGEGWAKAPLVTPKKVLGAMRGGVISIWKGVAIDPETGEVKKNRPLSEAREPVWIDLTEGIEDALSVVEACPEARVMAGISIGNMKSLVWPERVAGLVLWRQNDPEGSPAAQAFEAMVEQLRRQGKRVKIVAMPEGVKDANELVMVGGAHA